MIGRSIFQYMDEEGAAIARANIGRRREASTLPQDFKFIRQDGRELSEDDVLTAVLDAGAEEVNDNGDTWEVVSDPGDLVGVRTALQAAGIDYDSAEAQFVPSTQIELDAEGAKKIFRLIDALEDSDDVQNVYANYDVSDEVMELVDA